MKREIPMQYLKSCTGIIFVIIILYKETLQLLPAITEGLHRGVEEVGALIKEDFGVQGTGIDGDGEDTCGDTCLHTDGGILYHDGFIGTNTCFLKAHEVGLWIGLAVVHIVGGDHLIVGEHA